MALRKLEIFIISTNLRKTGLSYLLSSKRLAKVKKLSSICVNCRRSFSRVFSIGSDNCISWSDYSYTRNCILRTCNYVGKDAIFDCYINKTSKKTGKRFIFILSPLLDNKQYWRFFAKYSKSRSILWRG